MEAAPTGCYKCGRPGHWSRDCTFSPSNPNPSSSSKNPNSSINSNSFVSGSSKLGPKSSDKPKKIPRTRPKLTPDLLLSDKEGLGYVLRYFPPAFKYRGRGHEVSDLGNLIELYSEWHSRLLPYYSFDQFVHKVEQVAATRHVKMCLRELREKVAQGGNPAKLHEPLAHSEVQTEEPEAEEVTLGQGDPFAETTNADEVQEGMLHEIYEKSIEEPSQSMHNSLDTAGNVSVVNSLDKGSGIPSNDASSSNIPPITEEQRARTEANRLKALERAAKRREMQASQQFNQ